MSNDWTVDDGKKQVATLLMLCRLFREEVQDTYPDGKDYYNTHKLAEILGAAPRDMEVWALGDAPIPAERWIPIMEQAVAKGIEAQNQLTALADKTKGQERSVASRELVRAASEGVTKFVERVVRVAQGKQYHHEVCGSAPVVGADGIPLLDEQGKFQFEPDNTYLCQACQLLSEVGGAFQSGTLFVVPDPIHRRRILHISALPH